MAARSAAHKRHYNLTDLSGHYVSEPGQSSLGSKKPRFKRLFLHFSILFPYFLSFSTSFTKVTEGQKGFGRASPISFSYSGKIIIDYPTHQKAIGPCGE